VEAAGVADTAVEVVEAAVVVDSIVTVAAEAAAVAVVDTTVINPAHKKTVKSGKLPDFFFATCGVVNNLRIYADAYKAKDIKLKIFYEIIERIKVEQRIKDLIKISWEVIKQRRVLKVCFESK